MKRNFFSKVFQASLLCCLAVMFTACDDIFGSEDNPMSAYLSMSDKPVTLKVGDTHRRKAVSVSSAVVEYTSSKTDVATVDNEGLVTAKAEGTTTITATATGYSSQNGKKIYQPASVSYVVTVTPAAVYATSLSIDATLRLDNVAQTLTPTVTPSDATIIWTSSDEAVATVDAEGKVTPVAKGKATITATSGDLSATSTVYVYDKIVDINAGAATVTAGESWLINGNGTAVANGIIIKDGATVTLNGININNDNITCYANSTIILADGSTNRVTAPSEKAGIRIGGTSKTLTINAETAGTGKLTTTGGDSGAGIGSDYANSDDKSFGNIIINGGTIDATGGWGAAGIGTGYASNGTNTCGDITINGGTVTAKGGNYAAGIGTGYSFASGLAYAASQTCGAITIGTGVTSVTATKGSGSPNSIGKGYDNLGTQTCGTITIGGVVKAQSDFTAATYTYEP